MKDSTIDSVNNKVNTQKAKNVVSDPEGKFLEEFFVYNNTKLSDLGGFNLQKKCIKDKIGLVIENYDLFNKLKCDFIRGYLVSGPSGCGKSTLVKAISGEYNLRMYQISAPQLISALSGESENKIRKIFNKIKEKDMSETEFNGTVLLIDDIDSIIGGRSDGIMKDMQSRIITQLKRCIESFSESAKTTDLDLNENPNEYRQSKVFIFGTTSKPETIDSNLRRSGIFDEEIEISFPNEEERIEIIKYLLLKKNINLENHELEYLGLNTNGFVCCDLNCLIKHAGYTAIKRYKSKKTIEKDNKNDVMDQNDENKEVNDDLIITFEDICDSINLVKPNNLREGFNVVPNVTFKDIGGLEEQKEELNLKIVYPIKHSKSYKELGISASGVLLYGPPGCGKTLLAKAVANAAQANFISVKGPELLNKYVGESEKSVRELFRKARDSQPCIIFFDEFDALAPKRNNENNSASDRVVNQLLSEMDGVDDRKQIFLIAATNRKDLIDDAMLREGRLGSHYEVKLPNYEDRVKIFKTVTKGMNFTYNIDKLSEKTKGFSGADIAGLIKEVKIKYIRNCALKIIDDKVKIDTKNVFYDDSLFDEVLKSYK